MACDSVGCRVPAAAALGGLVTVPGGVGVVAAVVVAAVVVVDGVATAPRTV